MRSPWASAWSAAALTAGLSLCAACSAGRAVTSDDPAQARGTKLDIDPSDPRLHHAPAVEAKRRGENDEPGAGEERENRAVDEPPSHAPPRTGEAVAKAGSTGDPCRTPEPPRDPYRWYPALDLARVPFHTGSGPWGPQARIVAPSPPVIKRSVTVHTAQQLVQAGLTPGTRIVVGSSIDEPAVLFGDVRDIEIVVPKGKRTSAIAIGSYTPPSVTQRVRIRGSKPMTHSGGVVGKLNFLSRKLTSDVIIDGVDLNGEDGKGGEGLWEFAGAPERVAIVNVRGHSVAYGSLNGHATSFVLAGSSIATGSRPRSKNGFPEGWGNRDGDQVVYFRNYLSGTRYHRIRVHPRHGSTQYAWIAENIFVDPYEARIVSAFDLGNDKTPAPFEGLWVQCNKVYAHSKCIMPSFEGPAASYAKLTHNTFYGSFTKELMKELEGAHGPDHDYLTKTTFQRWKIPPKGMPPGDPREIPLPADDPSDDNPKLDGAPCPGP